MAGRYPGRKRSQVDYTKKNYDGEAWWTQVGLIVISRAHMSCSTTDTSSQCLHQHHLLYNQCHFTNMQTLVKDDDAAHSPELGGASQRNAKHSTVHDSTAAAVARKPGKSAAAKQSQAAAPGADEHEYVAPDTAPPLFKRLESHKRSLSSSDSGQSDQGPAKKKRGRPKKSAAAPLATATAADNSEDEPDHQEEEKQLPSQSPAKKKRGRPRKSAAAPAPAAENSREESYEEQVPSQKVLAANMTAKQQQGKGSKAAGATGVQCTELAVLQ
jgi:hypothetical protein